MPCPELRDLVLSALAPCRHLQGACREFVTWNPTAGHIPRGTCGACGTLEEVELVLVVAEPGDPHTGETYPTEATPEEYFARFYTHQWNCLEHGRDLFHRNIRFIMESCFPGDDFHTQMRKTWITESVLCSAPVECGPLPHVVWKTCTESYLHEQLRLLEGRTIALLGGKAQQRAGSRYRAIHCKSVAPPGCNQNDAREGWLRIAERVAERRQKTKHKKPAPSVAKPKEDSRFTRFPVVSLSAEYLVMGHLLRRNILTYKAPPGNEGYDLICIHPDPRREGRQIRVQVKSRMATDFDRGFPVKKRSLDAFDFLVVVFLNVGYYLQKAKRHEASEGACEPEFFTLDRDFIRAHHDTSSSWEKVRLRGLDLDAYKNERGFERIAEALEIPYPSK